MRRLRRLCEWLARRPCPLLLAGLSALLALPSLWAGLHADDYTIRAIVRHSRPIRGVSGSPWHPFSFLDGDPARTRTLIDLGWLPWWSDPRCRASFLRPVTALAHMLDYRVWPDRPMLMHAQSLAWFAFVVWAAATLYGRLIGRRLPGWVAALAALLFAVDEAHAAPAAWLANRNTLVAAAFGLLALLAHDRWRKDGWRAGVVLGPAAFLLALLAKELAVCAAAYLLAYAVFVDDASPGQRLASLLPYALVGGAWYAVYKAGGFGMARSGVYVDPARNPLRFLGQVARYGPVLLTAQWAFPTSETTLFLSRAAAWVHWAWGVGFLALLAVVLAPLVARDRLARFWGTGMVLSLLLACAPFPHDRLLMFVGLGAMGLLATWLAGRVMGAAWRPSSRGWRVLAAVFAWLFVVVHLVVAPLVLPAATSLLPVMSERIERRFATVPSDVGFARQRAVFVNGLSSLADVMWIQTRVCTGEPIPAASLRLSASCAPATLTRVDATTLVVRPQGGYLLPMGDHPGPDAAPTVSAAYCLRFMDLLFRGPEHPMPLGHTVELSTATVQVTALTDDGRPAEATFRFPVPLEHPSLCWLVQTGRGCEPFTPPAVGETVEIPSPLD